VRQRLAVNARANYFGGFAGRPRRNGPCSAPQASTAAASQTGPAANRASGFGKSRRFVYPRAVRFVTPRISAVSARPAKRGAPVGRRSSCSPHRVYRGSPPGAESSFPPQGASIGFRAAATSADPARLLARERSATLDSGIPLGFECRLRRPDRPGSAGSMTRSSSFTESDGQGGGSSGVGLVSSPIRGNPDAELPPPDHAGGGFIEREKTVGPCPAPLSADGRRMRVENNRGNNKSIYVFLSIVGIALVLIAVFLYSVNESLDNLQLGP
jgi:hypothetical protein